MPPKDRFSRRNAGVPTVEVERKGGQKQVVPTQQATKGKVVRNRPKIPLVPRCGDGRFRDGVSRRNAGVPTVTET